VKASGILSPVAAAFPQFDSTRWATAQIAREALDLDTLPAFDESVVLSGDHALVRRTDMDGNETHRRVIQFRRAEPELALAPEPLTPTATDAADVLTRLAAPRRVAAPAPAASMWARLAGLFR
jgi:hypothetical protein